MKSKYKPGPGWKNLNGPVWEKGMIRIHLSCDLVKSMITGTVITNHERVRFFTRVNGGNRKRGLMAYANHVRFGI